MYAYLFSAMNMFQNEQKVYLWNAFHYSIHVLIVRFSLQGSLGQKSTSQDALCVGKTNSKQKVFIYRMF